MAGQMGPRLSPVPLANTVFVVVDLETTGGSVDQDAITEIGAVRLMGTRVVDEFSSLVDPGVAIPQFISELTGITDELVRGAPAIDEVLPRFLDFARGAVLVAHNAQFDVTFLSNECDRLALPWPQFRVVDTVTLSRRVLARGETANHKLATLADYIGAHAAPCHRALDDARATAELLTHLLDRLIREGAEVFEPAALQIGRRYRARRRLPAMTRLSLSPAPALRECS